MKPSRRVRYVRLRSVILPHACHVSQKSIGRSTSRKKIDHSLARKKKPRPLSTTKASKRWLPVFAPPPFPRPPARPLSLPPIEAPSSPSSTGKPDPSPSPSTAPRIPRPLFSLLLPWSLLHLCSPGNGSYRWLPKDRRRIPKSHRCRNPSRPR